MSIHLFAHHRCCNGMFCWRRSVESLLAVYIWAPPQPRHHRPGGLAVLLYRCTTGGPPRRRIQRAFGRGQEGESFAKGLMQKYSWSTGHPRVLNELHLAFKYTWRLVGLVPWWQPQNKRQVVVLYTCSLGYFTHGFLSPSNTQMTAQESFLPHLPQAF